MSVAQSLGLTSKRANRALAAFASKYHIRESFAQQGKAQIKVCFPQADSPGWRFPDLHMVVQWYGELSELEMLHTVLPHPFTHPAYAPDLHVHIRKIHYHV